MDFEVLGPLRVRLGEQSLQLSAPMPRMLLGVLLTRANTPVPVDVLVDALWAGQRDPRAAKKLQLHVHRLRRALGDPARIHYENGGYTLRVHPGELDAARFESALAESRNAGQSARAVALLRAALRLWRGDPFSDIVDLPLLRAEADRLAERRLAAMAHLYTAELACGHAAAIVPELVELAARHPMREQLQGLLMTALYQAGRQAEALEVYQRTRGALVEQLGLEPGNELQRLEHAILTGDPLLEAPSTPSIAPAQLPADVTDFTGRKVQLATLMHLAAADRGTTVVIAITGKAGVGKTALAVHAAHRLRAQYPDGQLYVNLRGMEANPLTAADVLARFLRSLGVDRLAIPDDVEERAALYRSRLADRRLLIVLDDAACEAQLRPLLPGTPGCAVLVTSRARLTGLGGARPIDLDVLEPDRAVELLARVAGPQRIAAEPAAAREIVRFCGYLPLAIRVAGAKLGARPHWALSRLEADLTAENTRLDVLRLADLEVRASLARSYETLDVMARRAFRLLGLLDVTDFAPWVSAALLDIPQTRAEDLMDTLVDLHLLEVAGRDGHGRVRYRFDDLVRIYAHEVATAHEPEDSRLAAVHRAFEGWLALIEEASRSVAGSAPTGAGGAGRSWRPDPSVLAAVVVDPVGWLIAEQAALVSALERAYSVGSAGLGWALGVRLARISLARGCYHDWREVCELMLSGARQAVERGPHGVAPRSVGELQRLQLRLDEALDGFEATLAAGGTGRRDRTGRDRLASVGDPIDAALRRLERSLAQLVELTTGHGEAVAIHSIGTVHRLQRCHEKAVRRFQQVLDALDGAEPDQEAAVMPSRPAPSSPRRPIRLAALQGTPQAGW